MQSDVHIYYFQANPKRKFLCSPLLPGPANSHPRPPESKYARELWERIRREFPELRIYTFWDRPIGPHPVAMFEVNLFTPAQFGAFIPWLAIWRGPLSALVHPNTTEDDLPVWQRELRNHSQKAIWLGERLPLDLGLFKPKGA